MRRSLRALFLLLVVAGATRACTYPPDREFVAVGPDASVGPDGSAGNVGTGGSSTGGGGSGPGGSTSTGGTAGTPTGGAGGTPTGGTGGTPTGGAGGRDCTADGQSCTAAGECCAFIDDEGTCADFAGGIQACAKTCFLNSQCPSGCCTQRPDGTGLCAPTLQDCGGSGCRAAGRTCDAHTDCCGGGTSAFCTNDGFGPRTCGQSCTQNSNCTTTGCCAPVPGGPQACFSAQHCASNCDNSCLSAGNGACEDGRPGSVDNTCAPNTDCDDCGPQATSLCQNNCGSGNSNGICEDGGPGSESSRCFIGFDCDDCGPRYERKCDDTCLLSGDGTCDDVEPDGGDPLCLYGTDCSDCGVR
jgi:hypothetical protein